MRKRNRFLAFILSLSMALSGTALSGAGTTAVLAEETASPEVTVKILGGASDYGHGYYIKYSLNGTVLKSNEAGQRMNQIAWENMSNEDRMKLFKDYGMMVSERQKQFGYDFSGQMVRWHDDVTGWTALREQRGENIMKKEFPAYYRLFAGDGVAEWDAKFETADPTHKEYYAPDLIKRFEEAKIYRSWAAEAYEKMAQAEILKYSIAVKCMSGDLIQLITDRCLVPRITVSGSGLLSTEIATTAFDYLASITGCVDSLQDKVVGRRIRSSDATTLMGKCDELVNHYKALIDLSMDASDKTLEEIQEEYSARAQEYLSEQKAAVARHRQKIAEFYAEFDDDSIDQAINSEIDRLNKAYDEEAEKKCPDSSGGHDEEDCSWCHAHYIRLQNLMQQITDYVAQQTQRLETDIEDWRTRYLGNELDCSDGAFYKYYLANKIEWEPAAFFYPSMPDKEFEDFVREEQERINSYPQRVGELRAYAEGAMSLVAQSKKELIPLNARYRALKKYGYFSWPHDSYFDSRVESVDQRGREFMGGSSSLHPDDPMYLPSFEFKDEAAFEAYEEMHEMDITMLEYYKKIHADKKQEDQDFIDEYRADVADYKEAWDEVIEARDELDAMIESVPEYVKEQWVYDGHLFMNSDTELGRVFMGGQGTQAQATAYGNDLSEYVDRYYELTAKLDGAKERVKLYEANVREKQTFSSDFAEEHSLPQWNDGTQNGLIYYASTLEALHGETDPEPTPENRSTAHTMELLYRDFNGYGYGQVKLMDIYLDLLENEELLSTDTSEATTSKLYRFEQQVDGYRDAYSYSRLTVDKPDIVPPEGTDPYYLVKQKLYAIAEMRDPLFTKLTNVNFTVTAPKEGTRLLPDEYGMNKGYLNTKEPLAAVDCEDITILGVKAFTEDGYEYYDRLPKGGKGYLRIYYSMPDDILITEETVVTINGNEEKVIRDWDTIGNYCYLDELVEFAPMDSLTFTVQPEDVYTYDPGDTVTIECEVEGENVSYQWYEEYSYEDTIWQEILDGETEPILVLEDAGTYYDGHSFYCEATTEDGMGESNHAKLYCTLGIIESPGYTTYYLSGSDVQLEVKAKGNLTYQWYYYPVGAEESVMLEGETSPVLIIPNADESNHSEMYFCYVESVDYGWWYQYTNGTELAMVEELPSEDPQITLTKGDSGMLTAAMENVEHAVAAGIICSKEAEFTLDTPGRIRIVYDDLYEDTFTFRTDAPMNYRAYVIVEEEGQRTVVYSDIVYMY